MVPNTAHILELNSTQRNSSKLGVNIWVAKTTNKSIDTTQKSATLSMKLIQSPVLPIKPDGLGPPPGENLNTEVYKVEVNH